MNITVYSGVACGNDPAFRQAALELGRWIAQQGHILVYGGGAIGMMGALSNEVLDCGGSVVGIIPQFLVDREQLNSRLEDPIVVETMAERKALLYQKADAFVMLPGGIGTLEEVTEVLSQTKLGFLDAPVFILNVKGCYNHLIAALKDLVRLEFLKDGESPFTEVNSVEELAAALS